MTPHAASRKPVRALFVTYASAGHGGPAMMGVLKRVARLMNALPGRVARHWLHFGPLTSDPLVHRLAARIGIERIRAERPAVEIGEILSRVKPDVVVLGEGPGGGMMEATANVATAAGIPLACVENYYSPGQPAHFAECSPAINQWLLLGLPDGNRFGRLNPRFVLAPPLVRPGSRPDTDPPALAILGYDKAVKAAGLDLLNRLPPGTSARVVLPAASDAGDRERTDASGRSCTSIALPDDRTLGSLLAGAKVVVCKSGFQQMAEALALGTPCVAIAADGAVPAELLVSHFRPYVRYLGSTAADRTSVLAALTGWLVEKPVMPWFEAVGEIADPVKWAAGAMADLLDAAIAEGAL